MVIKHGWVENPRTEWRFLARKITDNWSILQHTMFDYRRVRRIGSEISAMKCHNSILPRYPMISHDAILHPGYREPHSRFANQSSSFQCASLRRPSSERILFNTIHGQNPLKFPFQPPQGKSHVQRLPMVDLGASPPQVPFNHVGGR